MLLGKPLYKSYILVKLAGGGGWNSEIKFIDPEKAFDKIQHSRPRGGVGGGGWRIKKTLSIYFNIFFPHTLFEKERSYFRKSLR